MSEMSPEDAKLDAQWRAVFGGPLPMLGAPEITLQILKEHLAKQRQELDAEH